MLKKSVYRIVGNVSNHSLWGLSFAVELMCSIEDRREEADGPDFADQGEYIII